MTAPIRPLPKLLPATTPSFVRANSIAIGRSQVGLREGKSGNSWNNDQPYTKALGMGNFYAWCVVFVLWCVMQLLPKKAAPQSASSSASVTWFKRNGQLYKTPMSGDYGFVPGGSGPMASDGRRYKHTLQVDAVDGDWIITNEGNTNTSGSPQGNGVYHLRRKWAGMRFGRPDWSLGVDPAAVAKVKTVGWETLKWMAEHRDSRIYVAQVQAFKKALDAVSPQAFHLDDNGVWGDGTDSMVRWVQKNVLGDKPDPKGKAFLGAEQLEAFCKVPAAAQFISYAGRGNMAPAGK